jgi:hypothetical protein
MGPPVIKPAELDPAAHVTVIHQNSSGNSTRGSHDQGASPGRNDHTSHTDHSSNTPPGTGHAGSH